MGNGNSTRHGYEIKTKTGDKKGMGTDVHIYITLISEDGRRSHDLYLDCKWRNDFEAGAVDTFPFGDEVPDIGPISKVEIHRYSTFVASEWFMEWVEITNHYRPEDKPDIFPFQRWVRSGVRFTVCRYDSCLPQYSEFPGQRQYELEKKRKDYVLVEKKPGIPKQ
ncbi:arachidonate 5-lipoxygenase-like, partial [Paramuricea clavata]